MYLISLYLNENKRTSRKILSQANYRLQSVKRVSHFPTESTTLKVGAPAMDHTSYGSAEYSGLLF